MDILNLALDMKKNPEKEDEYLELFVNLQREVHSKKAPLLELLMLQSLALS